jgi:hypothetical protein
MGLWRDGPEDVTKKLSLQHADKLFRTEDDADRMQYSIDVMDVVPDEGVEPLRQGQAPGAAGPTGPGDDGWQGWSEQHCINVAALPSESLLTVVSKKCGMHAALSLAPSPALPPPPHHTHTPSPPYPHSPPCPAPPTLGEDRFPTGFSTPAIAGTVACVA